ncbi:DUF1655 domain-containing protein [Lactococcus lactis]|uniref:DUF1655 domain-containing protein n=1 Tax=Lactococcus lactis TaxID=1358 RepID=UPI003D0F3122
MKKFITIQEAKVLFAECLSKARHHIEVDDMTDKLFDGKTVATFTFLGNGYQVELEG